MFRLDIAPKEIFLAYSTQFFFLTKKLVPGNVVMVAIDMCGKSPIMGEWIYGITWKHVYFNISVLFIVDTSSTLKLMFLLLIVSALMITWVAVLLPLFLLLLLLFLFIYLFIYLVFCLFIFLFFLSLRPLFLSLLSLLSSLLLPCCWYHRCLLWVCGYCCC